MVYLFSDGFESGDLSQWSGTQVLGDGEIPLVENTVKRKGTWGCYLHVPNLGSGGHSILKKTLAVPQTTLNCRTYILFNTLPTTDVNFNYLIDFRPDEILASLVNDQDQFRWGILNFVTSTWYFSDPVPVTTGVWYSLEFEETVDAINGVLNLYADNVNVISATGQNTGTNPISEVFLRANPSSPTDEVAIYIDDVVIADKYIGMEQAWFGMTGNMTWR